MSWYSNGYEGMKKEEERAAQANGPQRFWVKPGDTKHIIFVDDEPFTLYEHNPKINGDWKNWITCGQGISDNVPCCEVLGPASRYFIGYYTVIDCSEYMDKKGNKHSYEVKLLGAKMKTLKKFRRKKEDKGSLIGRKYKVTREDGKSPSVGDEFEYDCDADLSKIFDTVMFKGRKLSEIYTQAQAGGAEGIQRLLKTFQASFEGEGKLVKRVSPFNYMEVLKPRDPKELRLLLKGAETDTGGAKSQADSDEDAPF